MAGAGFLDFGGGVAVVVGGEVDVGDDAASGGHRGRVGCGGAVSRSWRPLSQIARARAQASRAMAIERVRADVSDGAVGVGRGRGGCEGVGCGGPGGGGRGAGAGLRPGGVVCGCSGGRGRVRRGREPEGVAGAGSDDAVGRESVVGLEAADGGGGGGAEAAVDAGRPEVVAAGVQRALQDADADARGGVQSGALAQQRGAGRGRGVAVVGVSANAAVSSAIRTIAIVVDGPRVRGRGCGSCGASPSGERCWRATRRHGGRTGGVGPPGGRLSQAAAEGTRRRGAPARQDGSGSDAATARAGPGRR